MASFKLNVARIQGCPPAAKLGELMEKYGLPEHDEFGVLNHSVSGDAVFGTIVRKSRQAVQRLDPKTLEVTSQAVEKVTVYPFGLKPSTERLEVYAGSAAGIEQMGVFFGSCLGLPTVTEGVEMDVPAAVEKMLKTTQRCQLKMIRVTDFAHNSYMSGTYAPKFMDSQHAIEFLQEYADFVSSASLKFAAPTGRASVTITPKACFTYSCNEDDQPEVQSILRKLL